MAGLGDSVSEASKCNATDSCGGSSRTDWWFAESPMADMAAVPPPTPPPLRTMEGNMPDRETESFFVFIFNFWGKEKLISIGGC